MTQEEYRYQVLATVIGVLLVVAGIIFVVLDLMSDWLVFIMVALGAGITFPNRLAAAAKAIAGLSPLKK